MKVSFIRAAFSTILVSIFVVDLVFFVRTEETLAATKATVTPSHLEKVAWKEKWEKILSAAKNEGSVRIYTSTTADVRDNLPKAFKARYDINLEFITGRPTELAQKVLSERSAGLYLADVFISGSVFMLTLLKPNDALEPIEPTLILPEVVDTKLWRAGKIPFSDNDRTSIGYAAAPSNELLLNTDMVKPGEISSFQDLLNPKWKGKIVLDDPNSGGGGLSWVTMLSEKIWGPEKTKSYLRELKKQDIAVLDDARLQVEWVAKAKCAISIAAKDEIAFDFKSKGAPIAFTKASEGTMMLAGGNGVGLARKAAHPNAAVIFVNWLLSKEGQIYSTKGGGRPSFRLDVPQEGFDSSAFPAKGDKTYLADEKYYLATPKARVMFKEIFESTH